MLIKDIAIGVPEEKLLLADYSETHPYVAGKYNGFNEARSEILNLSVDISKGLDKLKLEKIFFDNGYGGMAQDLAEVVLENVDNCGKE